MRRGITTKNQLLAAAEALGVPLTACCFKDELASVTPDVTVPTRYIVNLADSDDLSHGTHWVAVLLVPRINRAWYFDSYGCAPPKAILAFINRFASETNIMNKQVQGISSNYCGQYCLDFLCSMSRSSSGASNRERELGGGPGSTLNRVKHLNRARSGDWGGISDTLDRRFRAFRQAYDIARY